ncbi:hypothetical protein [uncultured Sphingomonas sp.]|uniref:hypothetical protein n=1 Tax=uncultured Sphingomonas sp. TaxID=158754 RepID=UPI002632FB06|nr:hypothetical protein [uncultured Sphingomonas sp.]
MKRAAISIAIATLAASLTACASHPKKIAVAPPPPAYKSAPAAPMPPGGHAGMKIPTRLSDGSYLTPNRNLSTAATVWHLRAALNVAALACRGAAQAAIVARYNDLLSRQKAAFAQAQARLAAEYRATGGDWQSREDDAMTRLYNYFSQDFARAAFCASAAHVLERADAVAPASFEAFANEQLPALDQPFIEFFRAYDAWRTGQAMRPMIAYASPAAVPVALNHAATKAVPVKPGKPPHLHVDISALQDQSLAGR